MIRSLSGRGQYRLTSKYSYLAISVHNWSRMTAAQRKKIVCDFDSAVVLNSGNHPPLTAGYVLPSSVGSTSSSVSLSVSPEDSGILIIPLVTLQGMWKKTLKGCCLLSQKSLLPLVVTLKREWCCH